jgi:hypothetical protein
MRRRLVILAAPARTAVGLPHPGDSDHDHQHSRSVALRSNRAYRTSGTGAKTPGLGGARADGGVERGSFVAGPPPSPVGPATSASSLAPQAEGAAGPS